MVQPRSKVRSQAVRLVLIDDAAVVVRHKQFARLVNRQVGRVTQPEGKDGQRSIWRDFKDGGVTAGSALQDHVIHEKQVPALSKVRFPGLYNPEAKTLCPPSQVNLKIAP